jgi:hypothetical protein
MIVRERLLAEERDHAAVAASQAQADEAGDVEDAAALSEDAAAVVRDRRGTVRARGEPRVSA